MRRRARERIRSHERKHGGRGLQQPPTERKKPGLRARVVQRGKPHLPIESRLVRGNEGRPPIQPPRFVSKFVGRPGVSVLTALDQYLRAARGHYREQSVR